MCRVHASTSGEGTVQKEQSITPKDPGTCILNRTCYWADLWVGSEGGLQALSGIAPNGLHHPLAQQAQVVGEVALMQCQQPLGVVH